MSKWTYRHSGDTMTPSRDRTMTTAESSSVAGPERPVTQASWSAPVIFGRGRQLAMLHAALEDALAGHGRLVLISGEPGIGKSALAEALVTEAMARGARVSWARAPETAGAPPYWLWTQT